MLSDEQFPCKLEIIISPEKGVFVVSVTRPLSSTEYCVDIFWSFVLFIITNRNLVAP